MGYKTCRELLAERNESIVELKAEITQLRKDCDALVRLRDTAAEWRTFYNTAAEDTHMGNKALQDFDDALDEATRKEIEK
jgi:hypothetical protein